MNPVQLACASFLGALGAAAIIFVIVLLVLYGRACRTPEN